MRMSLRAAATTQLVTATFDRNVFFASFWSERGMRGTYARQQRTAINQPTIFKQLLCYVPRFEYRQ